MRALLTSASVYKFLTQSQLLQLRPWMILRSHSVTKFGSDVPEGMDKLVALDEQLRSSIYHTCHTRRLSIKQDEKRTNEIWTIRVEGDNKKAIPIVLLHGMGGGSNMFLKNIDSLARKRDVILIDLPGFGMSDRPKLKSRTDDEGNVVKPDGDDVESFYTQTLEKIFQTMGLTEIILLGHSFGGYLSSIYCLSKPERVKHLILADPWGFTRERPVTPSTWRQKILFFLVKKLYYRVNMFTPFRILGPFGQRAFRSFRKDLNDRYNVGEEGSTAFVDYLYQCNVSGEPTGEKFFAMLSLPFAFARKPMLDRAQGWANDLDVTIICGEDSWMDSTYEEEIKALRPESFTDFRIVKDAGHHVHADNAPEFNSIVDKVTTAVDAKITEAAAI